MFLGDAHKPVVGFLPMPQAQQQASGFEDIDIARGDTAKYAQAA